MCIYYNGPNTHRRPFGPIQYSTERRKNGRRRFFSTIHKTIINVQSRARSHRAPNKQTNLLSVCGSKTWRSPLTQHTQCVWKLLYFAKNETSKKYTQHTTCINRRRHTQKPSQQMHNGRPTGLVVLVCLIGQSACSTLYRTHTSNDDIHQKLNERE